MDDPSNGNGPIVMQDGLKLTPDDAIRVLLALLDDLNRKQTTTEGKIKEVAIEHNRLVMCVEQLARIQGLEYSQDIKQWVSKTKLEELKTQPR